MGKGIVFMKRYGPPGILDTAYNGTICQVDNDCDMDIYVQVSKKEENPKWVLMGNYPLNLNKLKIIEDALKFKNLKL